MIAAIAFLLFLVWDLLLEDFSGWFKWVFLAVSIISILLIVYWWYIKRNNVRFY